MPQDTHETKCTDQKVIIIEPYKNNISEDMIDKIGTDAIELYCTRYNEMSPDLAKGFIDGVNWLMGELFTCDCQSSILWQLMIAKAERKPW